MKELTERYRKFNFQGKSFEEYWGFPIGELRDKIIIAKTSRVEGDKYITRLAPIDKAMKNNIVVLNEAASKLCKGTFVRSLDDILGDMESHEFSRQRNDFQPEEATDIEEDVGEDASFEYTEQM